MVGSSLWPLLFSLSLSLPAHFQFSPCRSFTVASLVRVSHRSHRRISLTPSHYLSLPLTTSHSLAMVVTHCAASVSLSLCLSASVSFAASLIPVPAFVLIAPSLLLSLWRRFSFGSSISPRRCRCRRLRLPHVWPPFVPGDLFTLSPPPGCHHRRGDERVGVVCFPRFVRAVACTCRLRLLSLPCTLRLTSSMCPLSSAVPCTATGYRPPLLLSCACTVPRPAMWRCRARLTRAAACTPIA
jgi:hypothetical protein